MKMPIMTYDMALKFLDKFDISTTCPACGHANSIVPTTFNNEIVFLGRIELQARFEGDGVGGETTDTYPFLPLICERCGHIRQFMYHNVLAALQEESGTL